MLTKKQTNELVNKRKFPPCPYNNNVLCIYITQCDSCGWNPSPECDAVRQSRIDYVLSHRQKESR